MVIDYLYGYKPQVAKGFVWMYMDVYLLIDYIIVCDSSNLRTDRKVDPY